MNTDPNGNVLNGTLYMRPLTVTRIHCPRPGCDFAANATTEGGAVRALSAHLIGAHMVEGKETA